MNKTIIIIMCVVLVALLTGGFIVLKMNNAKEVSTESSSTSVVEKSDTKSPASTPSSPQTSTQKAATASVWKVGGVAVSGTYADADTVKLADNSYRMYYAIQPEVQGNNFEIYSSISTDGVTWKKESGMRKTMATFPDVVKTADGKYRMYFQSAGVIKSAVSTDGLTFKDESGTRIDKTNDLGLTFDNVAAPSVLAQADGTYVMVYRGTINEQYTGEVTPNKNIQILLWATSTDGLMWTKKGMAIDSRKEPLYGLADGPELFLNDAGAVTLSFWSYTGVYWSTFASATFTVPEKVFALNESTPTNKFPAGTPGDPVYAKFGTTWYMYYGQQDGIGYATRVAQ